MPPTTQSPSAVAMAAVFASNQADAAQSCSQSPGELIPYVSTLAIQHRLAAVWPTRSTRIARSIRLRFGVTGAGASARSISIRTPVRSRRDRRGTCPTSCTFQASAGRPSEVAIALATTREPLPVLVDEAEYVVVVPHGRSAQVDPGDDRRFVVLGEERESVFSVTSKSSITSGWLPANPTREEGPHGRVKEQPAVRGDLESGIGGSHSGDYGVGKELHVLRVRRASRPLERERGERDAGIGALGHPGTPPVEEAHALASLGQVAGNVNAAFVAADDDEIVPVQLGVAWELGPCAGTARCPRSRSSAGIGSRLQPK